MDDDFTRDPEMERYAVLDRFEQEVAREVIKLGVDVERLQVWRNNWGIDTQLEQQHEHMNAVMIEGKRKAEVEEKPFDAMKALMESTVPFMVKSQPENRLGGYVLDREEKLGISLPALRGAMTRAAATVETPLATLVPDLVPLLTGRGAPGFAGPGAG